MRSLMSLLLTISIAGVLMADPPEPSRFEYSGAAKTFLPRLHGHPGALAYRQDYPGGFVAWQESARSKLKELLGLHRIALQVGQHQPTVQMDQGTTVDGYVRHRAQIETEPGVQVPFWVLRPRGSEDKQLPVVICAHGHDADGWNTYAGVYRDAEHQKSTMAKQGDPGVQAVKQGYIAVVPATRGLAKAISIPDPKGRHGNRVCRAQLMHCLLAGRTAIGERVWDTTCLLDWIVTDLPGVDAKRIGMLGNSGGGVVTVYVAALDQRVAVAHPSCSLTSYTSSTGFIFHCDCCLVPGIQVELADMSDVAALVIPRRLLAIHGKKDGLHSSEDVERAMERIGSIYSATKVSEKFSFHWGADGHKFYPSMLWPFLNESLLNH